MNQFTKEYYEDGVRNHISGYEDYRWMPTRSIPEALDIKHHFDFNTCVDYGCAKGFLVHALRIIGCNAFGEDISEYAVSHCHPRVKEYVSLPNDNKYTAVNNQLSHNVISDFKKNIIDAITNGIVYMNHLHIIITISIHFGIILIFIPLSIISPIDK